MSPSTSPSTSPDPRPDAPVASPLRKVAVFAATGLLAACTEGPARPNVLLVTIDTLRADRVGAYGYEHSTTPHLDALAQSGVLFERAYSHAPFTAPAHASLLTSLHPQSHGVLFWNQLLTTDAPTFQELFKARGYGTAAFHNHPGLIPTGITRGFDEVQARYFEPWQPTVAGFFDWSDRQPKGEPFAVWLHLWDAHRPYGFRDWRADFVRPHVERAEADLVLPYAERGFLEPRDRRIGRTEAFYNVRPDERAGTFDVGGSARTLEAADWQYIVDRYDASVRYADEGVGALIAGLTERGELENTIVVVTSDHGEALMERDPVWFTHDPFLYDEVLRVPLILRVPGALHAGTRVAGLVRGVDVLPTLLELADLPLPRKVLLQGRSMLPMVAGTETGGRTLFGGTQTRSAKETTRRAGEDDSWLEYRQVFTDGALKVIHDLETDTWSAFDLAADPGERTNLWANGVDGKTPAAALRTSLLEARKALPVAGQLTVPLSAQQSQTLEQLGYL